MLEAAAGGSQCLTMTVEGTSMNEDRSLQGLTRRGFLAGAAGVAAVGIVPSAPRLRAAVSRQAEPGAAAKPLAGANVTPHTYGDKNAVTAAKKFDGYVGMPLAVTLQKIFIPAGEYGSTPPAEMTQLGSIGCQFVVAIQPANPPSAQQKSQLAAWLTMLRRAGLSFRIALYPECNNLAFPSKQSWLNYWRYYAPTVQAQGIACCYDPGGSYAAMGRALAYFPSDPAPDELWIDFYATAFGSGSRIGELLALGQSAGVPTGLAEWGWQAGGAGYNAMSMPVWNDYGAYLTELAQAGHFKLGCIYWGSEHLGNTVDVIDSAHDPRIPVIRQVSQAVQAG